MDLAINDLEMHYDDFEHDFSLILALGPFYLALQKTQRALH